MDAAGLKASLENKTLRFKNPKFFNDPFDCEISYASSNTKAEDQWFIEAKLLRYTSQVGALCLTRNKSNLLMWAHYADEHKGGVLGIDTELANLDSSEQNIIPATEGSVIYTSLRPSSAGHDMPTQISEFTKEFREKLFLHKSIHWAYEEEVRIVRKFLSYRDDTYDCSAKEQEHEDIIIPKEAIKEIYFGSKFTESTPFEIINTVKTFPNSKVSRCFLDKELWAIEEVEIPLRPDFAKTT